MLTFKLVFEGESVGHRKVRGQVKLVFKLKIYDAYVLFETYLLLNNDTDMMSGI